MATLADLVKQHGEAKIVEVFEGRVKQRGRAQLKNKERREKLAKYEALVKEGKIK